MKIGIIMVLPIEYNTSSMLRCKEIILGLIELGHKITCFCPSPNKDSIYYSNDNGSLSKIKIERFKRLPRDLKSKDTNGKKVMVSTLKRFCLSVFRKIDVFGSTLLYIPERKWISDYFSENSFDILLTFSDPIPAHMIGKYVKKKNPKIRYIQQWGDPLANDTISKIAQPVWLRRIVEKSLLKPADRVCYVSPFTYEEQKKTFPDQSAKMFFLPTPSLGEDESGTRKGRLCIGYFGSYNSVARNIMPLYQAAIQNVDVNFLIVGDSDIILESTKNISIIQRVSHEKLKNYMQKVSVIVCLMNKKGNQIPGKVYHDAASTKDILFIKDGEYGDRIQSFFEKYNHYTFVDNKKDEINKAIKKYIECGVPYRKPVDEFRAINIAKKIIE